MVSVLFRSSWSAVRPALIPLLGLVSLTATTSVGVTAMAATATSPSRMQLSESLRQAVEKHELYPANLIPLQFRSSKAQEGATEEDVEPIVTELPGISLQEAAKKHAAGQKSGSVAFIVRRPGKTGKYGFWGVVKETGVDDEGLLEFHNDFYTFPLYKDEDKVTYDALGSRKLKITTWNPFRLWKGIRAVGQRMKKKGIDGNMKGEGLVQGGVFVFDKKGELQYAYEEETGFELELDEIRAVLEK